MQQINEGAVRLGDIVAGREPSQNKIARELGVATGVVTYWVRGLRRPSLKNALALESMHGIPVEAWHKPARSRCRSSKSSG